MPGAVRLLAPAKINLRLAIKGVKEDGMHLLKAPTVPLDLADEVRASLREDGRCVNDWRLKPTPANGELGLRAALLLQQESKTKLGVTLSIKKRVPQGAGLGGGSSDAAAVLLACNRLWQLDWPLPRLAELGMRLGSDVPFFTSCRQAQILEAGERSKPLAKPVGGFTLLLVPPFRTDTSAVFRAFDRLETTAESHKSAKIPDAAFHRNDLLRAAAHLHPELHNVLESLRHAAGEALMSGSGSTCFARLPSYAAAKEAATRLAGAAGEIHICRIMRSRVRRLRETRFSLGSGQAVRQRILAPSCVGSNPTSPA